MEKEPTPKLPDVKLATQDWVLKEIMDTDRRIEKAFHEQTIYLGEKHSAIEKAFHDQTIQLGDKISGLTRWMVGLFITMIITVLVAVLFR